MIMNRVPQRHRKIVRPVLVLLIASLAMGMAEEAAADAARTSPTVQPTAPVVRKTGILPPAIVLFEEQAEGVKPTARADWSSAAADAVNTAFITELAARQVAPVVITKDEAGPADLSRLYSVPDRISRDDGQPFPEVLLSANYQADLVKAAMERHQLDAVWIVSGAALLSAGGEGSSGPAAGQEKAPSVGKRLALRAALIDREGRVLYSDVVDGPAAQKPGSVDLCDPQIAEHYVRLLLAEFRTEQEKRDAAQAVVQAQEAKAAEQRKRELALRAGPPEIRVGLGIFFLAPDGVDLLVSYRPAGGHWQFGYRYVRWTDSFNDPFTGRKLTETTDTMQGPQVNYLFTPEETTSWYLGLSVLRWSRTEVAVSTGASDSDSAVAPFFGGGWAAHLGKHAFFNIGMFLSPGTELKTDTGVSSEEQSGGFDVQLQLGVAF